MASKPDVTVVNGKHRPQWLNWRTTVAVFLLLLLLAGVVYWFGFHHSSNNKSANAADQKALEQSLQTSAASGNDPNGVVYTAGRLISGQKAGTFHIDKNDLGQLYLQRATAYMQLKQYKSAVADYDTAMQLNSLNKKAALQGEVEAKYRLGERKQLIPLYQELISIMKQQTDNPLAGSFVVQYQGAIKALQNGQELQF